MTEEDNRVAAYVCTIGAVLGGVIKLLIESEILNRYEVHGMLDSIEREADLVSCRNTVEALSALRNNIQDSK